jgi:8-oxo-dGTP pyrophosphatase MutT (NUDIX family)
MSFLDRITECNRRDMSRFRPFVVDSLQVGWISRELLPLLAAWPGVFVVSPAAVELEPALTTFEQRSCALEPVLRELHARGVVRGWRNELYPVSTSFAAAPLLQMERAAVPQFGVRAYGVHMNAFVRRGEAGLHMWIARRSRTKPTYPGMLDNAVAGGQPIGVSLFDNLVKECAEEASIPAALARRARAVGVISYCMEEPDGLLPDAQFCFDLELPEGFVPANTDGEIDEFFLWPIERVAEVVRDTREFKFNVNLVILDFLIRHGVLRPDHPDYIEIAKGLRQ